MSFGREKRDSLRAVNNTWSTSSGSGRMTNTQGIVTWEDPDRRVAILKKLSYKFVVGVIDASFDVNNSKIC